MHWNPNLKFLWEAAKNGNMIKVECDVITWYVYVRPQTPSCSSLINIETKTFFDKILTKAKFLQKILLKFNTMWQHRKKYSWLQTSPSNSLINAETKMALENISTNT
jgi:hypothetical protein